MAWVAPGRSPKVTQHAIAASAPDPTRIVLSYRREDSAGHAGRLADTLLDRFGQASVFMAVESIEAGADFTEEGLRVEGVRCRFPDSVVAAGEIPAMSTREPDR